MQLSGFQCCSLTNRMWFGVLCTLIDHSTHYHSGQNVVDSRGADKERNLCQDFPYSDLKVLLYILQMSYL